MPPVLAVIGAVASVAGTVSSIKQQKRAAALQQQQQELATRRSQRQAIREAQIRRAQTMAAAQGLGVVGGSSAVSGGTTSLGSQLGGSLGFASQMSGLSREIGVASSKANTFGAIAGLGGTAFQIGAQFGGADFLLPGTTASGGGVNENLLKGIA